MRDTELKELISKKTRIQLLNRNAMADVPGVRNLKNRQLEWKEFSGSADDLPTIVATELTTLVNEFNSKFHEFSDEQYQNAKVIFAYYASNPSVSTSQIQAIVESNDPRKDQFLELIQWMDDFGVRMFMSPRALMSLARDRGQRNVSDKSNGSHFWLENFGYIWGLGKVGDYRSQRDAFPKSDQEAERIENNPDEKARLEDEGRRLVQVVTSSVNGAWGIYFSDGNKLYPVIGDNYYQHSKANEFDKGWVDYDSFGEKSGQHSKYFGVRNSETGKPEAFTYPTSSRFLLSDGEDDPQPKFVHKNSIKSTSAKEYVWRHDGIEETLDASKLKSKGNVFFYSTDNLPQPVQIPEEQISVKSQQLYYLWIKNDGTLWWVPNESRSEVRTGLPNPKRKGAKTGKPFPLTKEQVDHISLERGKHFVLSNPDKFVYSWDTLPERNPDEKAEKQAKMEDWKKKTQLMDDLYDFLSGLPDSQGPSVNLQATKYCIIGPRFRQAENTGVEETMGRMKSHHTHLEDYAPHGGDTFFGVRKDWVVVANEFNAARAESRGERGLNAAQSLDGLGPISGFATAEEAVHKAFSTWKINAPYPDQGTLKEAQDAFEHAISGGNQNQALPPLPMNPMTQSPYVPQNQTRTPATNIPNTNRYVGNDADTEEVSSPKVLAKTNCLTKSSLDYMRQIRRTND